MILVYFLFASIVVGWLRGGRLMRYFDDPLRGILLPVAAFALEAGFQILDRFLPWSREAWLPWAVCLEYALLFAFVALNLRIKPILVMGAAAAMNFAAMAANSFKMPVTPVIYDFPSLAGFIARVNSGELMEYALVDWDAKLWWLGDTIPIPWGIPGVASAGDLVMAIGVFWLVQLVMGRFKDVCE